MIIFTILEPSWFYSVLGEGPFRNTERIWIYNLTSPDPRYEQLHFLMPDVSFISEAALNDQGNLFEAEYYNALDHNEAMFYDLMTILVKEHMSATDLIILQIHPNSYYSDFIVESLMKYFYLRYGLVTNIVNSLEDALALQIHLFSPQGLIQMDKNINFLALNVPGFIPDQPGE